jgi:hypothetical protein
VIESGTVGVQRYVRWADGTQIITVSALSLIYASASSLQRSMTFTKAFSNANFDARAGFIPETGGDVPNTIDDHCTPTRLEILSPIIGGHATTGLTVQADRILGMTNFQSGDTMVVSLSIIGRWFE